MLNSNKGQIGVLALLLCALALPAWAQLDTGSIVGVVQDKSGAVLADSKVTVTNIRTGRVYEAQTNGDGQYEVPGLPASVYKVAIEHSGFKSRVIDQVVLYATDHRAVDAMLDVGQASEQVTVTAETISVNTQTSESGATIDSNEVQNLPLNGRDFTNLMTLVPGSVITGGFGQTSLGGYETSLAGVNILLDGADATRIDSQATSTQLGRQDSRINRVSVDSIEEFKVMSGNYSAEYGRSYGDIVNVITKSGGNTFHGGLFEFLRNDVFDAKNYFQTGPSPIHLNQFGGSISGPIVKDKLFFFFNYEGVRQVTHSPTGPVAVMTAATRALAVPDMVPVVNSLPLPNPALGPAIFPNPVLGQPPIVRTDLGIFEGSTFETDREDTGSLKVDYRITQKDSLALRYNIDSSFTNTQYGIAADQVSPSPGLNHLFKATWDHTFRPTLLNEFGVAYNRPKTDSLGGGGPFPSFQCSAFWGCGNSNTFGDAPGPALFSESQPEHSLQFLDTLTWIKGRHSIAAGFDIRHVVNDNALFPQNFIAYDSELNFLANQGDQFSTLGHNMVSLENTNYDFFVQDDIRVSPRLTLNLGVRYEYNTVLSGHLMQNFSLAALMADPLATDTSKFFGPLGAPLYNSDRNNFGPRIGFSWDPYGAGKTVIRGGFGIFYNPQLTGAALSLAGNFQQGYNINVIGLLFGITSCTPGFNQPPVPSYYISYPLPNPLPVCTPPPPPNVNTLDPNLRDSYSMHWSFGVQQEIARSTIFELQYVANRGLKLPGGAAYAGEELNLSPFAGVPNQISPNFGNVRFLGDFLRSDYQSLQASLRRHVSKGLVVDANYTWAHEFDDAVNILTSAYQDSHNPMGDYANGDIDVRNNFTLGAVYTVPTAQLLPKILGQGWQATGILQARSGLPFPIEVAAPFLGIDQIRPNFVPGQSIRPSNYSVPFNQININAFSVPTNDTTCAHNPVPCYGDVPRNAGRGPGFTQVDFGLSKQTMVTERYGLQLGATAFNILNHPNFANPSGILENNLNFGQSTSTVGNKVGPGTSRQIQLFVRMTF
jgi:outer membrane receptor protein involved in Fe transport